MKNILTLAILLTIVFSTTAQEKRPLTGEDILKWNRISEQKISNDGEYIIYKTEPWKGDPVLHISKKNGKEVASFNYASRSAITNDSKFVLFNILQPADTIRMLKLKKTKKDDMPKDKLGIYKLETNELDTVHEIKSYKIPAEWAGWMAWQAEKGDEGAKGHGDLGKGGTGIGEQGTGEGEKGKSEEGIKKEDEKKKEKKESDKNGYTLNLKNLETGDTLQFPFVTQYEFAEEKSILLYISTGDDKDIEPGIYLYDIDAGKQTALITGKGEYKQLSQNKEGSLIAFLADTSDTRDKKKKYSLYASNGGAPAREILTNTDNGIPDNWEISENGRISFSESEKRIFFGSAPIKPEKDTTILEEELPHLDVWTWNEPVLHTEQLNRLNRDQKKTYMAVYHFDTDKMAQLETEDLSGISLIHKGDHQYALGWSNNPYAIQTMWEGSPSHNDIFLVNMETGQKEMIKEDLRATPQSSPLGKYLYWYNAMDSSWYTYNLESRGEFRVTNPGIIQCADELNDIPNPAGSYRTAGWLKGDAALLVNDRFDIWQVDPENKTKPINLTVNGKENMTTYRLMDLERSRRGRSVSSEDEGIDPKKTLYLSGHNEITRAEGYYKWSMDKPTFPEELFSGEYKLGTPFKAKNADLILFTMENFEVFPDLQITDSSFKKHKQISNANPQQKDFIWGTAELVSWTSLDGRILEGTLHKPENFHPGKKYPMIVNFYEKSSQGLFSHHIPERGRSTIDYHYYTSNGYLVFNPDIYYKEGYPGEDAFNCVMPGITALIEKGLVDQEHIGAQGHSWGGYQVAYLATRTNLFAAIESGAPVVNMFSAYGGIRWGSGLNRSFQYEHTQSRIGKSIWGSPLRYMENSPIFTMDKVKTPILIMHNDDDGSVPWYQGIEYFIALRRLGKPAWLLNYNNADHWPTRLEDRHDFQIRLAQFFDHYLKGEPMPKWMKNGIPAVDKGAEFGY